MVILIPARAGSKRIPGKALKLLGGKPLIAWTIESALAWRNHTYSEEPKVIVVTEDEHILNVAYKYKADGWMRPLSTSSDDAPDLMWLSLALVQWPCEPIFMVLRPTSPFVSTDTMARAWTDFEAVPDATAMRAMRPVTEHPMKMWARHGVWMRRLDDNANWYNVEACSSPTQSLPRAYVQTAGLELIRRSTLEAGSLTGDKVLPLFLEGPEALDINTPDDWARAEAYVATL